MPGEATFAWMTRIKDVEREYSVALLAISRFEQQAKDNPQVLADNLRIRHITVALDRLEGTFLVRLFSEFETGLRHFLRAKKLKEPTGAELLINKVRDKVGISFDDAVDVHKVREYRNSLVHDVLDEVDPVTMREARTYCSTFLSWLQRTW